MQSRPIDITWYVKPLLEKVETDISFDVERIYLNIDETSGRPILQAQNISFPETALSVPAAEIGFVLADILNGRLSPVSIKLSGARLTIVRLDNTTFDIGFQFEQALSKEKQQADRLPYLDKVLSMLKPGGSLSSLAEIKIASTYLMYKDLVEDKVFSTNNAELTATNAQYAITAKLEMQATLEEGIETDIVLNGALPAGGDRMWVSANIKNAPAPAASIFGITPPSGLISARNYIVFDTNGTIQQSRGYIEATDLKMDALTVSTVSLNYNFDPDEQALSITDLSIASDRGTAQGEASIEFTPSYDVGVGQLRLDTLALSDKVFVKPLTVQNIKADLYIDATKNIYGIDAFEGYLKQLDKVLTGWAKSTPNRLRTELQLAQLATHELPYLWPHHDGHNALAWIETHVTKGYFEDIQLALVDEALKIDFGVRNLQLIPLEGMQPLTIKTGTAYVTDDSFYVRIERGTLANSLTVDATEFSVKSFYDDHADLGLRASGTLDQTAQFLRSAPLSLLQGQFFDSIKSYQGEVHAQATLRIPFYKEDDTDVIQRLTAKVEHIMLDRDTFSLSSSALHVSIADSQLETTGAVRINTLPAMQMSLRQNIHADTPSIILTQTFDTADLAQLDLDHTIPEGQVRAAFQLAPRGNDLAITGDIDLRDAQITVPIIGLGKPIGTNSKLRLQTTLQEAQMTQIDFTLSEGEKTQTTGYLRLDPQYIPIELQADLYTMPRTQTQVRLTSFSEPYMLQVTGNSIDVSHFIENLDQNQERNDGQTLPTFEVNVDVECIWLHEEVCLNQVKGHIRKGQKDTVSAHLTGRLQDQHESTFSIEPSGHFSIHSDNAGAILTGLGITDQARGGILKLEGIYDIATHTGSGKLNVDNLVVTQAPMLAQLLSLVSVVGAIDALTSGGITFDTIQIPFETSDSILNIKEAYATSASLGLSASGSYDTFQDSVNISGAVSPMYLINGMLGDIPVLGEIVTGDKGEGIFAATYQITGSTEQPNVRINPLSMLTPGVLREVFKP